MSTTTKRATRDGFGTGLIAAARDFPQVVGLCADLTDSTKMRAFATEFPDRFIEVGVAEQNLAGLAAGCALAGKKVFAASYACFHPANSWGVIRTSIAYSNLNVTIVGAHAGLVTGEDGATHQSLEDIALMQVLPHMTVVVPADAQEAHEATYALAQHTGPSYLRTSKYPVADLEPLEPFYLGAARLMKRGSDITFFACGVFVEQALSVAKELEKEQISVRVFNMHTIKPLDSAQILAAAQETWGIFTFEDHQHTGGLGSAVAHVLAEHYLPRAKRPIIFRSFAVADSFGESGPAAALLEHYGLSVPHLTEEIKSLLRYPSSVV